MHNYLLELTIIVFGMCIGSFMNVCIYRLPNSKSITNPPRSICPNCGGDIKFYDNIPVLSYLWLKGRCRHCHATIPFRYPMVEIMGGLLALCVFFKSGLTMEGLIYYAFIASLLVITFIDLDHQIIPDAITLPGIPIFFFASFLMKTISYKDSALGILAGGGSLFMVAWTYKLITAKDGMGGGDIKLLAMIGSLTGWQGVVFTIMASSTIGTLAGTALMLRARKDMKFAIPFGPFLSIGAIMYIFFGSKIIYWYLNFLR